MSAAELKTKENKPSTVSSPDHTHVISSFIRQWRIQDLPERRPTPKGWVQPIIWPNYPENCMTMKEICLKEERAHPKFVYVDPPLFGDFQCEDSDRSRISRGNTIPRGGFPNLLFGPISLQSCRKMKKLDQEGRVRVPGTNFGSANGGTHWLLRTPSAANQILSTIVAPFYPYLTFHLIKYSYSTIVTLKCFCYVNNSIVLHFLHSVPV